jgi:2-dehydro-3-deoxygluconokinase
LQKIITFGEIMGRLAPDGKLRFGQALPGRLNITFGGAEANVAVSVAGMGGQASFVTALPKNPIADACVARLRGLGVDTSNILRVKSGRLGLYFLEHGADQRPSNVVYDRDGSAIAVTPPDQYPWPSILAGAAWLHVSGITPAVSRDAAQATQEAARQAKAAGLTVSCDLNFRKKLWNWEPSLKPRQLAQQTMRDLLPFVDLLIANEEDAADVLDIHAGDTDVQAGKVSVEKYPAVAREIVRQFPNISRVAVTLRQSISASHNDWGAMLYVAKGEQAFFAPLRDGSTASSPPSGQYRPYEIHNIVDRVGAGDAFGAGLIFASLTPELDEPQTALSFATAASCLAHTIEGDFNFVTRAEIETLMKGSGSGRVVR